MQAFYSHLSKQLGYYASVLLSEGGLNLMFVTNYSKEERMAIVMECRKSGLTDALWCKQHDIPVGTFYSWVKNFRRQGIAVPAAYGKNVVPVKQEVVKVDIVDTASYNLQPKAIENPVTTDAGFLLDDNGTQSSPQSVIEISIFGANIKFSDTINPAILSKTFHLVKELSC